MEQKWTKELITYFLCRLLLLIHILCREISNNTNNLRRKWFWIGSDCWNSTSLCLGGLWENWRIHLEIFPVLQKEYYEFIQGSFPNCCNENSNTCMKQKEPSGPVLISREQMTTSFITVQRNYDIKMTPRVNFEICLRPP